MGNEPKILQYAFAAVKTLGRVVATAKCFTSWVVHFDISLERHKLTKNNVHILPTCMMRSKVFQYTDD